MYLSRIKMVPLNIINKFLNAQNSNEVFLCFNQPLEDIVDTVFESSFDPYFCIFKSLIGTDMTYIMLASMCC